MTDLKQFSDLTKTSDTHHHFKRILIVVLILACAAGLAVYMVKTKPKAIKAPRTRKAPLVECMSLTPSSHQVTLEGMGTVIPSISINLKTKVSGEVISIANEFIPGGRFKKGDIIMHIDPQDYNLDIRKKESLVHVAKANLDLELGRQDVAKGELDLMQKSSGRTILNNALALRKPQLDQAQAQYDSAMTDLQAARLNKERTVIRAPFNAMVLSRSTHKGSQVSSLETLAVLVGTDSYWIEATLPVAQLSWLFVPGKNQIHGSKVIINSPGIDEPFQGEVIRILGQLNDQSRLAGLLIQVNDPLSLTTHGQKAPLMLNDYVRIDIKGKSIDRVVALPRALLRSPGHVWVYTDSALDIRDVHMAWSDDEHIYIDQGLTESDCIITSGLSGVTPNMALRSMEDQSHDSQRPKGQKP